MVAQSPTLGIGTHRTIHRTPGPLVLKPACAVWKPRKLTVTAPSLPAFCRAEIPRFSNSSSRGSFQSTSPPSKQQPQALSWPSRESCSRRVLSTAVLAKKATESLEQQAVEASMRTESGASATVSQSQEPLYESNIIPKEARGASQIAATDPPTLAGAGGGLFFFWQLGAFRFLRERYDVNQMQMVGASAGALVSTIAACNIEPKMAVDSAYRISNEAKIWDKKLGLLGIWGGLLRLWLDEILPQDAHSLCSGRLKLVVTDVLARRQEYLSDFTTRQDLIDANMCSVHIPLFLDWKPISYFKGRPYLDGSFDDFVRWRNSDLLTLSGQSFVLDYSQDTELSFSRLDFLKLRSYESVLELMEQGEKYAARLEAEGAFEPFFGSIRLPK